MTQLPILELTATKEQLIVALNEADKLLMDNIFFKILANKLGKEDAKRKELDENMDFILSLFETNPQKVIVNYNLRALRRSDLQSVGTKLFQIGFQYAINRIVELQAHGMTLEHASTVAYNEVMEDEGEEAA